MMALTFTLETQSGAARAGRLATPHGEIPTPCFMPVGTLATVKGLTPALLREAGARIVLANTYHLALRPGAELVEKFGGVAAFMAWHGPTLTDSGGYQVFSLAQRRQITDQGVRFLSHIDGSPLELTPESATRIQQQLGADIFMCFDDCAPADATYEAVRQSLERTSAWAKRCREAWTNRDRQALFGIVQGGLFTDLRTESAQAIGGLDLPGNAIGGVSVGETPEEMERVVAHTAPLLPPAKPRYLMGVGRPEDILMAIGHGVDMFDCVMPTRCARNCPVFTPPGKLNHKNPRVSEDAGPIEAECDCYACRNFSRAYLRHLLIAGEMLGPILLTVHNVRFYLRLVEQARAAIQANEYAAFARRRLAGLKNEPAE